MNKRRFAGNCPINERTADGVRVGRCWFALVNRVCPRHGDVSEAVKRYCETGSLTCEPRIGKARTP